MKLNFLLDRDYDLQYLHDTAAIARATEIYATSESYLKKTVAAYQSSWDEINDAFFQSVERITGFQWAHTHYECVVSVAHSGISNWDDGNRIIRGWKENPYTMRRITAHELLLAQYFYVVHTAYPESALTQNQIWALAEIAAFTLTAYLPEAKEFWPWNTEFSLNHNYPHLVPLQLELRDIFLNRTSFDQYMKAGIELVRRYPTISPEGIE